MVPPSARYDTRAMGPRQNRPVKPARPTPSQGSIVGFDGMTEAVVFRGESAAKNKYVPMPIPRPPAMNNPMVETVPQARPESSVSCC